MMKTSLDLKKEMLTLRLKVIETKIDSGKLKITAIDVQKNCFDLLIEGVWSQNRISIGTIIHVLDPHHDEATSEYSITNSKGILVVEPENLVTCTSLASSLFCERKAWLNNLFLGQIGTNRAMLVGTLTHEIFQYGVKNRIADIDKLTTFLDRLLDDAFVMLEIFSVEAHIDEIRKEAVEYISSVREWIEHFMFSGPRFALTNDSSLQVKVVEIKDIEENVWSTKYGLKGKIDVTGLVRVYDARTSTERDKIIPLELKTGNPNLSSSHAAQVSLYSMMIEDRYAETNQGFVIYLKNSAAMHNVALTHSTRRDLIQRRNELVRYTKDYHFGPEMANQTRICKNCEKLTECVLVSEIYTPERIQEYSNMIALKTEAIGHLDESFKAFFTKHHERLIVDIHKSSSTNSFWTQTSEEAEANNTGFGGLLARPNLETGCIEFKRRQAKTTAAPITIGNWLKKAKMDVKPFNLEFKSSHVAISLDEKDQDMSSQNSSTALAMGYMKELAEDHFTVKVFEKSVDFVKPDLTYRVDKLEKRDTRVDVERRILVRLLAREDWRCDRIRQLLLDPKYLPVDNLELNLFVLTAGFAEITELEDKQQRAVVEAIATDNYYILDEKIIQVQDVQQVLSVLTRIILKLNRTVIIAAPEVDDLTDLMRTLDKHRVKFAFIDDGKTKARYTFAGHQIKLLQNPKISVSKKFDLYIKQLQSVPVIITSYAVSLDGLLFTRRTFDYSVSVGCDKVKLLVGLSPMFCSDRHILVDVKEGSTDVAGDDSLGNHIREKI